MTTTNMTSKQAMVSKACEPYERKKLEDMLDVVAMGVP